MAAARTAIDDPERTPSARVLREMRERYGNSYVEFALARSLEHRQQIMAKPLAPEAQRRLQHLADESLVRQRAVEESDSFPFEEYRQRYLSRDFGSGPRPP
jgi:glutamate--cysteine ligase